MLHDVLRSRTVRVHLGVKPVGSRQGPVRILTATGFSLGWTGTVLQALLGVLLERFGGAAKVHTKVKPVWSRQGPVRVSHRYSVGGGHILIATGFSLGWAGAACPGFLGDCEGQPYPYRANNV
jgi:hypothetical protein